MVDEGPFQNFVAVKFATPELRVDQFRYGVDYGGAAAPRTQVFLFPDSPEFSQDLIIGDIVTVYNGETVLYTAAVDFAAAFVAGAEDAIIAPQQTPTRYKVTRAGETIEDVTFNIGVTHFIDSATDNGNFFFRNIRKL